MRFGTAVSSAFLFFTSLILAASPAMAKEDRDYFILTYDQAEPLIYEVEGRARGMYVDILHILIKDGLGREIRFRKRPWKRAQKEVEAGIADLLLTVPTDARQHYAFVSSQPVFPLYFALYTYQDHPKLAAIQQVRTIRNIVDLDLLAVTNIGNGWHRANVQDKGVRTYEVPGDRSIAGVLALKRADIMIDITITMNHVIRKNRLTDKLVLTDVRFGPTNMHLMLGRESPHASMMPEIDRMLNRIIEDGRLREIIQNYSSLSQNM